MYLCWYLHLNLLLYLYLYVRVSITHPVMGFKMPPRAGGIGLVHVSEEIR